MSNCTVVKRHSYFAVTFNDGKVYSVKGWFGICPKCNKLIKGSTQYYSSSGTNTRKTAKDAVYRHLKAKH